MNDVDAARRALIAERLKAARQLAGLSQGHVAKILGMHRPSISEIEAGNRRVSATNCHGLPRPTMSPSPGCWARLPTPWTRRIPGLNSQPANLRSSNRTTWRACSGFSPRCATIPFRESRKPSVTYQTRTRFDRCALANRALHAAVATRATAELNQHDPICIYALAETLDVTVRFNNINMEGMYQRGARPRIHLSALRPLARRAYNCAHELGHHVFGHGLSIDELRKDAREHSWDDPKGIPGRCISPVSRSCRSSACGERLPPDTGTPETATPAQFFTIACDFGGRLRHAPHAPLSQRQYDLAIARNGPATRYTKGPARRDPRP